jgi:hypothetical protein
MKTTYSLAPTHNPSVKGTSCGRPQAAPYVERVCQAWHRTNGVQVPVSGIGEAED